MRVSGRIEEVKDRSQPGAFIPSHDESLFKFLKHHIVSSCAREDKSVNLGICIWVIDVNVAVVYEDENPVIYGMQGNVHNIVCESELMKHGEISSGPYLSLVILCTRDESLLVVEKCNARHQSSVRISCEEIIIAKRST